MKKVNLLPIFDVTASTVVRSTLCINSFNCFASKKIFVHLSKTSVEFKGLKRPCRD